MQPRGYGRAQAEAKEGAGNVAPGHQVAAGWNPTRQSRGGHQPAFREAVRDQVCLVSEELVTALAVEQPGDAVAGRGCH